MLHLFVPLAHAPRRIKPAAYARRTATKLFSRRSLTHAPLPINLSLAGEALDVASGQDEYLTKMTTPASDEAKALGEATSVAPWAELHASGQTMFRFSNAWTTDAVEAKTLAMFAYMLRAKKVMEIGMFTGYGALTIAEVLPPDGKMVSCELDPFLATFSKPFFDKSPHGHKIEVRLGPALETMKGYDANKEGGGFDMIFIDADKGGYAGYYEAALTTPGLLADGGVLVVDNTLFKGQAWLPRQSADRDYLSWNDGGSAIAAFNEMVANDPRVEQVILPVRDGITIVRRKGGIGEIAQERVPTAPIVPAATTAAAAVDVTDKVVAMPSKTDDAVMSGVGGKTILERMRLDAKVALVTGGGQGIGRAFAHALSEAGATVVVVDLDLSRAEKVALELTRKGGTAIGLAADVADEASVKRMVDHAVETYGGLHIAINNAGINKNSAAEDTPMAEWDATFGVNTRGVFMCCQHEARHMLKNGGGKIINTASWRRSSCRTRRSRPFTTRPSRPSSSSRSRSRASGSTAASTSTASRRASSTRRSSGRAPTSSRSPTSGSATCRSAGSAR